MKAYIGIDPSVNSTGITILIEGKATRFFIVHGGKLTKKELAAQDNIAHFDYVIVEKNDLKTAEDSHQRELMKTQNIIRAADEVYSIIKKYSKYDITIVIEGISLGSLRGTNVAMDLAGLNYLIRSKVLLLPNVDLIISPPKEIKKFATGNGNCNKDAMVNIFKTIYPKVDLPKLDDIADSYFMSCYGKEINNK